MGDKGATCTMKHAATSLSGSASSPCLRISWPALKWTTSSAWAMALIVLFCIGAKSGRSRSKRTRTTVSSRERLLFFLAFSLEAGTQSGRRVQTEKDARTQHAREEGRRRRSTHQGSGMAQLPGRRRGLSSQGGLEG